MSIGTIGFLNPAVLLALLALPLIWWLLRATPPAPQRIAFPATRLLKGLKTKETTPARTPWWLTLIRLLAAACLILGLAEPILNAFRGDAAGTGPVVVVVDNGWASAAHWDERKAMMSLIIGDAERHSRSVIIATTAPSARSAAFVLESPKAARDRSTSIEPQPIATDRAAAAKAIGDALASATGASIYWLSDGIDGGSSRVFVESLARLAGSTGKLLIAQPNASSEPLGLRSLQGEGGKLSAVVLSPGGAAHDGLVLALSSRGQRLAEAGFRLTPGSGEAAVAIDIPLELRNQVARFEIAGERSAGAVSLLGAGARWNRVGLVSGTGAEQAQPLLSPLYYIERALLPYAELVRNDDANTDAAIESLLKQRASVLMLADIGKLVGATAERVAQWIEGGGILVRFAGPRLEQGGDALLPAPLRLGGRSLGGSLSWSTPQPLGPFEASSPFNGLVVPDEVRITRQVLADPALLQDGNLIWARLADGTPLVTAMKRGSGWIVLFHVTANPEWSNLPISGLFVEMLQRLIGLTGLSSPAHQGAVRGETAAQSAASGLLAPVETLDGFGQAQTPPPTVQPLAVTDAPDREPDATHPPGIYGPPDSAHALNVVSPVMALKPIGSLPAGVAALSYRADEAKPLKPSLFSAALGLLLLDILGVIALQLGLGQGRRQPAAVAPALALAFAVAIGLWGSQARAQEPTAKPPGKADDAFALMASLKTHLAYVRTGDPEADEEARLGLQGLSTMLEQRTAVEPAEPIAIDVTHDELSFFPILYWPVVATQQMLDEPTANKVNAFMREGGLIVFDTRDFTQSVPSLGGLEASGNDALQKLTARLDIPRLEPVPSDHVLTKSFYLLKSFPGRYDSGEMWVEAQDRQAGESEEQGRRVDGVSSVIITSNDFAGAWALDEQHSPLFPVIPGGEEQREMAFRVGINIVMYALTGNYKADQVHVPALLERLGQ